VILNGQEDNKWTDRQNRLEEAFEKLREEFEGQEGKLKELQDALEVRLLLFFFFISTVT